MKKMNEKTKMNVQELSQEELENTFGGSWWEVKLEDNKVVFIFHYYDDDKPK